jgi:hypothetical protein
VGGRLIVADSHESDFYFGARESPAMCRANANIRFRESGILSQCFIVVHSGQLPSGLLTEFRPTPACKIDGRSKNALAIPISCENEKLKILAAAVALANGRRFPSLPFLPSRHQERNILSGRPLLRYLFERAMCDGPQAAQGGVAPLRTELQFLCDVATAFVVAAVREDAAGLFQNEIHVCNRPIIQFGHGLPLRAPALNQHPLRATRQF